MTILDISPDGSEMLLLKPDMNDETARGSILSAPVLGGYPRLVRSQLTRFAQWSPDGRSIVYADLNSVYVSDRDGGNPRKIWDAPGRVGSAFFSTDSRRIRVTVNAGNTNDFGKPPTVPKIWELNSDGSSPHRLELDWPEGAEQQFGRWTADGKHFIFMSGRDGLNNIYEVR